MLSHHTGCIDIKEFPIIIIIIITTVRGHSQVSMFWNFNFCLKKWVGGWTIKIYWKSKFDFPPQAYTPNAVVELLPHHNQNNTTWLAKANEIDAKKMNVSAASLAPDSSVRKATPSDNTERTARSGAVVHCARHGLDKNIVSTTAPERAVLTIMSLGVALRTDESGASEAAETFIFLASISLAFAGHVVLFWLNSACFEVGLIRTVIDNVTGSQRTA